LAPHAPLCRFPCCERFLFEPYQITESRALGADCVLIILAALADENARALLAAARRWEIDALVEIHDEHERDRALALGADMIGINNRDLRTFVTDSDVTLRLAPAIPRDILVVAESGLSSPADLRRLADAGVTVPDRRESHAGKKRRRSDPRPAPR